MNVFQRIVNAIKTPDITNQNTLLYRDLAGTALGVSHGGQRSLYDIYGYPDRPQFNTLYNYSTRSGIANRIVMGVPKSCWSDGFEIYTDKDKETPILEDELATIYKADLIGTAIRADSMGRIGNFSAIYVGVPDGREPSEPLGAVRGKALEAVYFRPFAYDGIQPHEWEQDVSSERYGLPVQYQLQVMGRGQNNKDQSRQAIIAHWSRVIHIAEDLTDSPIEGVPALLPVFNRILDLDKVLGGSAEAYFRNARGKIAFEIDPEFGAALIGDADGKERFDQAAKRFTNNQQDQIAAVGSKIVSISTPHQSPIDTVKSLLWEISGQTRIPMRMLTGEGAGQYAGNEDKVSYNVLIDDRRTSFCQKIVVRLLEILDECGAIALPDDYHIEWIKQDSTTEAERADIANTKAAALASVMTAASQTGETIDLESALEAIGLEDVEVEAIDEDMLMMGMGGGFGEEGGDGGGDDTGGDTEETTEVDTEE